jgi:hypothetical protein
LPKAGTLVCCRAPLPAPANPDSIHAN